MQENLQQLPNNHSAIESHTQSVVQFVACRCYISSLNQQILVDNMGKSLRTPVASN